MAELKSGDIAEITGYTIGNAVYRAKLLALGLTRSVKIKIFIWRAGKFIVPMVLVLGILNTIDTEGNIGNEDSENSVLSVVGKAITPVFEPKSIKRK